MHETILDMPSVGLFLLGHNLSDVSVLCFGTETLSGNKPKTKYDLTVGSCAYGYQGTAEFEDERFRP